MQQVIIGGHYDILTPSTMEYHTLVAAEAWDGTENKHRQMISASGDLKTLRIRLKDAPGSGNSRTFTLRINGSPSSVTVTLQDAETQKSDTVNSASVSGGDYCTLSNTGVSNPTSTVATWTLVFDSTTSAQSLMLGGYSGSPSLTTTEYNRLIGGYLWSSDIFQVRTYIPTSGTIKNLYVLSTNTLDVGQSAAFTVYKNGVSQSLTCTIPESGNSANDTTHSFTVAQLDYGYIECNPAGSANLGYVCWGCTFEADTDGESIVANSTSDSYSSALTEYNSPNGAWRSWSTTEYINYQLTQECTFKKLVFVVNTAPGSENSIELILRCGDPIGDTNLNVLLSDAATSGADNVDTHSVSDFDYSTVKTVPTSYPSASHAAWVFVCYIAPAAGWSGKISGITDPAKIMGVAVADIAKVIGVE